MNAVTAAIPERPACSLCGGTGGNVARTGGRHELCAARAAAGAPTPSLGDTCPTCRGGGCLPKSPVCPVVDPSPKAIEAWAPKCTTCNGTGVVGGSR